MSRSNPNPILKLAWLSDIHINKLNHNQRRSFYQTINQEDADIITISGDIATADNVCDLLQEMADACQRPIFFVLGNHDYHLEQLSIVRERINQLCQTIKSLHWLPLGHYWMTGDTVITGIDGWADARHGDYTNSRMHENDHRMALDFIHYKKLGKFALLKKMQHEADQQAHRLKQQLENVVKNTALKQALIITHFPPFKEASFYQGAPSEPAHLPFYCSKATGDVITAFANQHPHIEFTVLCGHTHSECRYQASSNVNVYTGGADYGSPCIQRIFEFQVGQNSIMDTAKQGHL